MTHAGERVIDDGDSHLMELPDFLTAHADPTLADELADLPSVLTSQFDPGRYLGAIAHDRDTVSMLMTLGDELTKGPKWHGALGAFNGSERSQALDLLGFR